MADANKTESTLRITEAAAVWLRGLGCKPVETEVTITTGWVADVAAAWRPTPSEAIRCKLIPSRPRWRDCGGDFAKHSEATVEWDNNHYGALPDPITIVHEVKVTVGDFRGDKKWSLESPADMRVLSMPLKMIPPDDWPDGWWVLLHREDGSICKVARRAPLTPISDTQRLRIVQNIAERRCNRSQYRFWKDLQQSHRNELNARVNRERVTRIADAVLSIATGEKDVDEAIDWHLRSISKQIPPYLREQLAQLYPARRQEQ